MTIKEIKAAAKKIHGQNKKLGYWKEINTRFRQATLINSEFSEAIDAHRKNKRANKHELAIITIDLFRQFVKGTIEEELSDAWIRLVDWHYYLLQTDNETVPKFEASLFEINQEFEANINELTFLTSSIARVNKYYLLNFIRAGIEELAVYLGIDLPFFVELKMKYNQLVKDEPTNKRY